jgi:hypothetical protein
LAEPKKQIYQAETVSLPEMIPAHNPRARSTRRSAPLSPAAYSKAGPEQASNSVGEEIIHRLIEFFTKS